MVVFFHEPEGTSFMEYPIFGTETIKKTLKIYNYGSKPKDRPGPFWVVPNSMNKTYIGHDGTHNNPAGELEELEDKELELEEEEVEEEEPATND